MPGTCLVILYEDRHAFYGIISKEVDIEINDNSKKNAFLCLICFYPFFTGFLCYHALAEVN